MIRKTISHYRVLSHLDWGTGVAWEAEDLKLLCHALLN
jgi:hypothetical protein